MKQGVVIKFIARWIVATVAIYAIQILPGITVLDFGTAVGAGLLLGLLNAFLRPVLIFLTLPATVFSLGLFIIVINAFILYLVGLSGLIEVGSFGWAILGAVMISIISSILNLIIFPEDRKLKIEVRRHHK